MARNYVSLASQALKPRFELTALIDIIFILVLFFAVSTSFTQQRQGLTLTLPNAVAVTKSPAVITISIDRKQRVYWNGTRVSERQLAGRVQQVLERRSDHPILLQADRQTPYVRVVSVLDAIRMAGGHHVMLEAKRS
jgi:biopolymer transport protein ExbD